jgi:hypothetical protein
MVDTIELRQYLKFYPKIQMLIDVECQHCSNRDNEPFYFLNKNFYSNEISSTNHQIL